MRPAPRLAARAAALAGVLAVAPLRADDRAGAGPAPLPAIAGALGEIVLPAGDFAGGMVLEHGGTLVGAGAGRTRIVAGAGTALAIRGGEVSIRGLTLVGGNAGLDVSRAATVRLAGVAIEGGQAAIRASEGARVELESARIACRPGQPAGVAVDRASLAAVALAVIGPCRRSVDVAGGVATLRGGAITGATDAGVRAVDAAATIEELTIAVVPGSASAAPIFAARSAVTLEHVGLVGGEHGLLAREGRLVARRLTVGGAHAAGLALNGAVADLETVELAGPFSHAALLATERSQVAARGLRVRAAGAAGLLAVRARLTLDRAEFAGARADRQGDFGHAVVLHHAAASFEELRVRDAQGVGLYAADARVRLGRLWVESSLAGLAAATGAQVDAARVDVGAGCAAGLVAWQGARIAVAAGRLESSVGAVACTGAEAVLAPGVEVASVEPRRTCEDRDLAGPLAGFLPPRPR